MKTVYWMTGRYAIEHSYTLITISSGGYYIRIEGQESVDVFDVFTDDCENEEAIDKYFDIAKLETNDY